MIKIVTFLLFLISLSLIFVGVNKLVLKLSYRIKERYLQYRLIIATVLFVLCFSNSLAGPLALTAVGDIINLPISNSIIKFLIPQRSIELIFLLLCTLGLNLMFAVAYLVYLALVKVAFIKAGKQFVIWDGLPLSSKIRYLPWFAVNKYYEENDGVVSLKSKGYVLGLFISRMKFAAVIVWGIELLAMYIAISFMNETISGIVLNVVKNLYLLPISSFFLFEQIQLFLEGPEEIKSGSIASNDITEELLGNVESLIPCYHEVFSDYDVVLCSEKGPRSELLPEGLRSTSAGNDQIDRCDDPELLSIVINQLQQSNIPMQASYQNAVISLINGNSIVVKDNAEGEFNPYYLAYINFYVSRGQKALILCNDDEMVDNVYKNLDMIRDANGSNMLLVISRASELDNTESVNVVVCSYEEFLRLDIIVKYKAIFECIRFSIFPDVDSLLEQNNVLLEMVLSKLHSLNNLSQFIFISPIGNSMIVDRIQHLFYFRSLNLSLYNNDVRYRSSGIMVWKGEGYYKLQTKLGLGDDQSSYLGSALPLAIVAIKNDFHRIHIIGGKSSGDDFYLESSLPEKSHLVNAYLGSHTDISSKMIIGPSKVTEQEDLKIIVAYDDEYNFINTLWRWFKYSGKNGTIIHVISPFYMMREFIADTYKKRIDKNEHFEFIDNNSVLDYSRKAMLLALLAYCEISEDELNRIKDMYQWNYDNLSELLLDILKTARDEEKLHGLHNYYRFYEDSKFEPTPAKVSKYTKVRLTNESLVKDLKTQVAFATIDFGKGNTSVMNILKNNIHNYYLSGQTFVHRGNFYVADTVRDGVVYAIAASPIRLYDYYTVSDFCLENATRRYGCNDNLKVDFNILEADVTRRIYGYVASAKGNDFADTKIHTDIYSVKDIDVIMSSVPILEINIGKRLLGKNPERAVYLLSVLMNGLFKTLYPDLHQNIIAVPDMPFDVNLCKSIMNNDIDYSCNDLIKMTVPGIRNSTTAVDAKTVRLFVIEFSSVEYGLVDSLYQNRKSVFTTIFRYLNWYLESGKGKYLNYGMETVSDLFAPEELISMLRNALQTDEAPIIGNDDNFDTSTIPNNALHRCSFCGRETIFAWKYRDGREMCGNCHDHIKSQAEEIETILTRIRNRMIDSYHIKLSSDIHVKFQSKDAIERAAGKVNGGRIMGFYNHDNKQLWIERKGPEVSMQSTMSHELTHAWQFAELDMIKLGKALRKYSRQKKKLLLEGHAVYVQIEVMEIIGEPHFAQRLKEEYLLREDAYGKGYRLFDEYYHNKQEDEGPMTPFEAMEKLVQEIIDGGSPIEWPSDIEKL